MFKIRKCVTFSPPKCFYSFNYDFHLLDVYETMQIIYVEDTIKEVVFVFSFSTTPLSRGVTRVMTAVSTKRYHTP